MKSLRQTTLNVSTHGYFHPVNETASSTVDSAGFVAPPSVVPLPRGRVTLHLREIEAGESAHFVPSPAQQLVIDHTSGAMLVLAGPGTGKTFTLTQAVTERITRDGFEPSEILVLTFARKAADEIRERIALAAPSGSLPHVATFHSLALALVTEFGNSDVSQPTLWSAPQQELSVRELLRSIADEPAVARSFGWPESLREALTTRGLAIEIRNALGRAQSLGMSASKLASVTAHSLEWSAVAKVYEEYLETLDQQLSLDYNELISTALELTARPEISAILQQRYKAIYVDEYQDTDPLQIEILRNILGRDAVFVAVGDPDQSIYAFRGANQRAIKDFATTFAAWNPTYAALTSTRRCGENIRAAAYAVIAKNSLSYLPSELAKTHRNLTSEAPYSGEVTVTHYESDDVEAAEVAEKLLQLAATSRSTDSPLNWSDFAILVRSGTSSVPVLERALMAANIPVTVKFDDVPLSQEPAVAALLTFLEAAAYSTTPVHLVQDLLTGPLGGCTAHDLRHIARLLRSRVAADDTATRLSETLLVRALDDPTLDVRSEQQSLGVTRFIELRNALSSARALRKSTALVENILWQIWNDSSWSKELQTAALHSDSHAHHDIDSVLSLFDHARDRNHMGLLDFVSYVRGLVVSTERLQSGILEDAVTIMTAHRSKGLEWKAVFICGANEGVWPDISARSSLLQPERLTPDSLGDIPDRAMVIAEERRLFFVACTRAKKYLYISTTAALSESGTLASRFVNDVEQLIGKAVTQASSDDASHAVMVSPESLQQPRYSTSNLIASLRRAATDPQSPPAVVEAAVSRLAYLASRTWSDGSLKYPHAHPAAWWSTLSLTENDTPVADPTQPLHVRGSSLQVLHDCSLSWFMSQQAAAQGASTAALTFGSLVHACVDALAKGLMSADPADITREVTQAMQRVQLVAPWLTQRETAAAIDCVTRFCRWFDSRENPPLGTEIEFLGQWKISDGVDIVDTMTLRGTIDYLEVSDSNVAYVVDFKTSSSTPSKEKAQMNMQLGLYQAAVARGLLKLPNVSDSQTFEVGGAALVMLRKEEKKTQLPTMRIQDALAPDPETGRIWIEDALVHASRVVRSERFEATVGDACGFCPAKIVCPAQPEGKGVLR